MIKSNITVVIKANRKMVWDCITDNQNYAWRSDISKIETKGEEQFVEYTKTNFPTFFTITKKEPLFLYEFDMQNANLTGHWTGKLTTLSDDVTQIELIEEVEVRNPIMRLLAKSYLKKQQKQYIQDLQREIKTREEGKKNEI